MVNPDISNKTIDNLSKAASIPDIYKLYNISAKRNLIKF